MSEKRFITFPRTDGPKPWYVGKNTWRRMTETTRAKFRAWRDAGKPCKLAIDEEPPTLGEP